MADVNSTATQNQTQQQTQTEPQKQPTTQVSGTQQQTQTTKPEDNSNGNELTVVEGITGQRNTTGLKRNKKTL